MSLLDQRCAEIREHLLMMASLAERSLSKSLRALAQNDPSTARTVEADDFELDQLELQIDDLVVTFMMRERPVARDLRLAVSASHIGGHLERIGDQAVSVSRRYLEIHKIDPDAEMSLDHLTAMGEICIRMMRAGVTGLVENKADGLIDIVAQDKEVDLHMHTAIEEWVTEMSADPQIIPVRMPLVLIARSLERAGDHAKNIAEEVHFLLTAIDIRHGGLDPHVGGSLDGVPDPLP